MPAPRWRGCLPRLRRFFRWRRALPSLFLRVTSIAGQFAFTKARYAELLADYHKSVISAFGNVEDALTALRQTGEQQKKQQKAADKAKLSYDLAAAQFHAGTINILTLLNTENSFVHGQRFIGAGTACPPAGAVATL